MRSLPTFTNNLHELRVIYHRPHDQNVITSYSPSQNDNGGAGEEEEMISTLSTETKTNHKKEIVHTTDSSFTITSANSDVAAIADSYSYHSFYSYDQSHQDFTKGCNTPCTSFDKEIPSRGLERCLDIDVLQHDIDPHYAGHSHTLDDDLLPRAMDENDHALATRTSIHTEMMIPMMYFDQEQLVYTPHRTTSSRISYDSYTFWIKRDYHISESFTPICNSMNSIDPFFHDAIERRRKVNVPTTMKIEDDDSWGQFVDLMG